MKQPFLSKYCLTRAKALAKGEYFERGSTIKNLPATDFYDL